MADKLTQDDQVSNEDPQTREGENESPEGIDPGNSSTGHSDCNHTLGETQSFFSREPSPGDTQAFTLF